MINQDDSVRREVLTYLARLPQTIQERGPHCIGEVAVQIGNCLLWIHHRLESGPKVENPLHESAQSVYALGKQFRQVGLHWWDKENNSKLDRYAALEQEIGILRNWLTRIDETVSRQIIP